MGNRDYVDARLKQLGKPKKHRRMGLKGYLTKEEQRLVSEAKGGLSTASEIARSMNVPTAIILNQWKAND